MCPYNPQLPDFDDCRCECHNPVYGMHVSHVAACCKNGKALAWGTWESNDGAEMVTQPAEYTERNSD